MLRALIGIALGALAMWLSTDRSLPSELLPAYGLFAAAWIVSVLLTDKYTHKYPYRYFAYLTAAHTKAAILMALVLGAGMVALESAGAHAGILWNAFWVFALLDFAASVPRRSAPLAVPFDHALLSSREIGAQVESPTESDSRQHGSAASTAFPTLAEVSPQLGDDLVAHIRRTVPESHDGLRVAVIDDRFLHRRGPWRECKADLVVSRVRVNDLQRINRFLIACGDRLRMGGHFVGAYEPLEQVRSRIEAKYGALARPAFLLHFAWFRAFPKIPFLNALYFLVTGGRNRDLSKAEVWGRLSFCGFRVCAEEALGERRFLTARRVASPITNKKPSYYPIVRLSKVGLDGTLLQTHKVRSMYPYSEFLQKQIFEEHGLVGTGKFKNDFRLTEYGKWLRRYWIDELPQIYDWLRGDIKLAGLRATSPHYLSLYPREFIDLYIRVKPGLVPPLFNESTQGFEQVVAVEMAYLESYRKAPTLTDWRCLWATFQDIVFRGVRSK